MRSLTIPSRSGAYYARVLITDDASSAAPIEVLLFERGSWIDSKTPSLTPATPEGGRRFMWRMVGRVSVTDRPFHVVLDMVSDKLRLL
jgi:hypothetical protein